MKLFLYFAFAPVACLCTHVLNANFHSIRFPRNDQPQSWEEGTSSKPRLNSASSTSPTRYDGNNDIDEDNDCLIQTFTSFLETSVSTIIFSTTMAEFTVTSLATFSYASESFVLPENEMPSMYPRANIPLSKDENSHGSKNLASYPPLQPKPTLHPTNGGSTLRNPVTSVIHNGYFRRGRCRSAQYGYGAKHEMRTTVTSQVTVPGTRTIWVTSLPASGRDYLPPSPGFSTTSIFSPSVSTHSVSKNSPVRTDTSSPSASPRSGSKVSPIATSVKSSIASQAFNHLNLIPPITSTTISSSPTSQPRTSPTGSSFTIPAITLPPRLPKENQGAGQEPLTTIPPLTISTPIVLPAGSVTTLSGFLLSAPKPSSSTTPPKPLKVTLPSGQTLSPGKPEIYHNHTITLTPSASIIIVDDKQIDMTPLQNMEPSNDIPVIGGIIPLGNRESILVTQGTETPPVELAASGVFFDLTSPSKIPLPGGSSALAFPITRLDDVQLVQLAAAAGNTTSVRGTLTANHTATTSSSGNSNHTGVTFTGGSNRLSDSVRSCGVMWTVAILMLPTLCAGALARANVHGHA